MNARYHLSLTTDPSEIALAQQFRGKLFRGGTPDFDELDALAIHAIMRDRLGRIVCVFRMMPILNGEYEKSYSAKFYDLRGLKKLRGPALELGRFCVDPEHNDPDIIRTAWSALTRYVFDQKIELLFGCSSFKGADAGIHAEAFALLKDRHLAPRRLMPRVKAPKVFRFARKLRLRKSDSKLAQKHMPPLLRSYLLMGAWVSDHAVVDHDLDTVHVFTGVELKKIPAARKRLFLGLGSLLPQR